MALAAGKLRHRLLIQKPVTTQNPNTGEMQITWTDVASVWGSMEPLSAREFIAANAQQSEVKGKAVIRHRDDVDATMRIVYRGKTHNILGVLGDNVSGLEYMTLPISEGVRVT